MSEEQIESPTIATQAPAAAGFTADDLASIRDLVIKATPNAVPELVTGATVAELQASAASSASVYDRIRANIEGATGAAPTTAATETPPAVPAGGAAANPDLSTLPTSELLKRGIAARRAQ